MLFGVSFCSFLTAIWFGLLFLLVLSCMLLCCVLIAFFSSVSLFTCSLYVSCFVVCAFQIVSECHRQCLQCFCLTYPGGIVLLLWVLLLCVYPSWWLAVLPCVMHIMYDLLCWLWSPLPMTVPWVNGVPSSHWTTTVDQTEKKHISGSTMVLIILCCLLTNVS